MKYETLEHLHYGEKFLLLALNIHLLYIQTKWLKEYRNETKLTNTRKHTCVTSD